MNQENPNIGLPDTEGGLFENGTFYFTNFTNEDFVARWDNIEYVFPANKTTPIIIPTETPIGIQSIRRKFAEELATREFYKTEKFSKLNNAPTASPATYTVNDLTTLIQKCLIPLEKEKDVKSVDLGVDNEQKYSSVVLDGTENLETIARKSEEKQNKAKVVRPVRQ